MAQHPHHNLAITTILMGLVLLPAQAIKIDYDNEFFAKYSKGVNSEKINKPNEALAYYKLAYEFKHRDAGALTKLGLVNLNNIREGQKTANLNRALGYFNQALALDPADPVINLMLAKTYQELGDNPNAIKFYNKAANLDPENILLKANLGRLYFEEKDFKKAIEIFNRIILAYPENLKARSYLGASLQATDNYLAAIEQYNFVLNYEPNEYSIAKNLGDSWLAVKQLDKAQENYEKAKAIDPKVPNIYADIAYVAKQKSDFPTAISNYRQALELKDSPEWRKALAYSLWSNNDLTSAITEFRVIEDYAVSGYLYQLQGNLDGALADFQKAIEVNPKDNKTRFNLARLYHERGDIAKARAEYVKVLEQKPNDTEALFLLAVLEQERGNLTLATKYYKDILQKQTEATLTAKQPNSDGDKLIKNNVHYNLGLAYKQQQDLNSAEQSFQELLDGKNRASGFDKGKDVYKELSFIKIALAKDTEAEKIINDWLKEDPTSVEARNIYADFLVHMSKERRAIEQLRLASVLDKTTSTRLKLANLLHSQNNLYEALAEYQMVLKDDPANLNAMLGAANNFKTLGFRDEAINIYGEIIKKYPEDVLANYNYGLLMQEANQTDKALIQYQKVAELNPNFMQVYYVMGLCYWDLKQKDKAREVWNKFLVQSSDENLKNEINKIINEDNSKQVPVDQPNDEQNNVSPIGNTASYPDVHT